MNLRWIKRKSGVYRGFVTFNLYVLLERIDGQYYWSVYRGGYEERPREKLNYTGDPSFVTRAKACLMRALKEHPHVLS